MPAKKLIAALGGIDWNNNVAVFIKHTVAVNSIARANLRLSMWCKQFEDTDTGNPALCFTRELQIAGQHVAALTALALYKPAAAAMRTVLETALYYTYFRSHPSELSTLASDPHYYISKGEVLEFHKKHTRDFAELQKMLGLVSRLEEWYSRVSGIVHGQIPGAWVAHTSLSEVTYRKDNVDVVVEAFQECDEIVHRLFLCTVGRELWDGFSSAGKKHLISGLAGNVKAAFGLDSA
jgi:hypothetical protein